MRHICAAMNTEQQSLSYLHLPPSKPFERDQSKSDTSITDRPASPASTISSRRSVSSMKQLLPLRLRPAHLRPQVDLASWLDNTVPSLQRPVVSDYESELREEGTACIPVPWMSSAPDIRLSRNLSPDQYRETPVYSGPGSPTLSRAYFGDQELCYNCSPRGSVCDELCIVSDYEDRETPNPYSQEILVNYTDISDTGLVRATSVSTDSLVSSRTPKFSTGCNGVYIPPDEATWMKSSLSSWVEGGVKQLACNTGLNEVDREQNPFEEWLESESTRSSSSFSSDEVLSALATKLAPAKAHVVDLNKVIQPLRRYVGSPRPCSQDRPATPYRLSRRRSSLNQHPSLTLDTNFWKESTIRQRQRHTVEPSSSVLSDLPWEHGVDSPGTSSVTDASVGDSEKNLSRHYFGDPEPDAVEESRTISKSIYDVIIGFPQKMLFLDTPCVVDIRNQNLLSEYANEPQHFSESSHYSSSCSLPLTQLQVPSGGRRTAINFFAPLARAAARKSSLLRTKIKPPSPTRPSSSMYMDWKYVSSQSNALPPDLSLFQQIFPNTQDWWRGVLYAHLVAFNYIRENQPPRQPRFGFFPSKACETLGISYGYSTRPMLATDKIDLLMELEGKLVSCITWVTNCMTGISDVYRDTTKFGNNHQRDVILARTLAELVKVSESGGFRDTNMQRVY